MTGISWGGFNALQVAALRPPALEAIITACSTDDRYADDIHYMGGCLITENMSWASNHVRVQLASPRPRRGRRALARDVDGAPRARRPVDHPLARARPPRRAVEARLGV